jgi:hypothetical protein
MAALRLGMQILVDTPVRVFGFQRTPPYMHQEIIALLSPYSQDGITQTKSSVQLAGFRVVPEAGVLILDPSAKLVNTRLGDYEFPSGGASDWTEATDSGTSKIGLLFHNSAAGQWFDVRMKNLLPANAAFYLRIARGQVGQATAISPDTYYTIVEFSGDADSSADDGSRAFRLILLAGMPAFLQAGVPDGAGGWLWGNWGVNGVQGTNISDCNTLFEEQNRVIQVEWIPFPEQNVIVCKLANGKETLVFRGSNLEPVGGAGLTYRYTNNVSVPEGKIRMWGQNGSAGYSYFPMQFANFAQMVSGVIDIPFVYQGNGGVYLGDSKGLSGFSVNYGIAPSDYTGTRVQYFIEITGPDPGADFADSSPVITTIQMRIPPVYDYTSTIGQIVDVSSRISEVQEHQWFDAERGLVRTQVGLMFDNTNGGMSGFAGIHRAVQYSRWLEYQASDGTMQPLTAPIDLVTGWTGMRGSALKSDPTRSYDAIIEDNLWPLERCQAMVLPCLDGWCCLAAQRFVMNMQGRDDAFIADVFKSCDFGPNPQGCPHLKLPLGVGTSPRMSISPEQSFLSVLQEINEMLFAVMWSDSQGVAQIMPYYPGIYQTPFKGTFGVAESGDPADSDFLTSMQRRQILRIDTDDKRTGVAFFGLDPSTNMVQGTFLNIDDYYPGYIANIHGFRQNLVKVSNLFVDPVFTDYYAYAALQRLVLPNVYEEHGASFLPNLFALDRYAVDEDNELISGIIPMVVEQITSRFHVLNPNVMGSTVAGRWAYNLL